LMYNKEVDKLLIIDYDSGKSTKSR
jgi:hypothetical protein